MSNLSEYVKKATSGKSELTEVMERRKSAKAQELENLEFDALIAEAKKKLADASPNKIDSSQATNFATMMFAGRTPAEIKEIIHSLTQEEIDKFAYMSARMDPNNFSNVRGLMRESNTTAKDIVEAIKIGVDITKKPESSGIDMKGIAEIFKAGVEAARVQQPTNPQGDLQYKLVENTLAELKATREEMSRQDRSRTEKEIAELKARPSGFDELVYNEEKAAKIRKIFGGTDAGAANEFTLKREEMQQTERLEDKKIGFEEKKWKYEKENEGKIIEQVKDLVKVVGEGPIGNAIKMLGEAQADKMRGSVAKSNSGRVVQVKCPSCSGVFPANEQLATITCPLCGVPLSRGSQPAPQEPQPQETQAPEKTQESQAQTEQPPTEEQSVAEQPANQ